MGLAGAARVLGAHGVAVHCGCVIVGRRDPRPDGLGGDAPGGFVQRDRLTGQRLIQPGRVQRLLPASQRLGEWNVL